MRNKNLATAALAALAASLSAGAALSGGVEPQSFTQIERGRYLTIAGDCGGCHTIPGSGAEMAGGRVVETPFGNLVGPNITPDPETGIGAWSDDQFIDALTKGRGRGGTYLYPAMPYPYMTRTTREDALAIRAYLNTLPAVRNAVQPNQLPFPLSIRAGMAAWDALFFTPGTFTPDPNKSAEWNRGAYLAEGLMHCGACHTPKNLAGGDKSGSKLQGYALQGWFAPDITNDTRRGIGGWSVDDIVEYLKTGHNRTSAATGLMSEVVTLSTSKMTDADLRAIATYLKNQPAGEQSTPAVADANVMKSGEKIYADECSGCHTPSGQGIAGMFPSLKGSPLAQSSDPTSLLRLVLRGARSASTDHAPTAPAMPQFAWLLSDQEIAAVLTYVRNAWGNSAPPVDADTVASARKDFLRRRD